MRLSSLILFLALTACGQLGKAPTLQDDPFKASDQNTSALTDKEQNLLRLARSTRAGGDDIAAIKLYRDAMNQSKGSIRAHLELADMLGTQKNYPGMLKILRAAEELQPKNADVKRLAGNVLLASQNPAAAIESFDRSIELAPRDGRAYSGKGVALDSLGKHAQAQVAYREGLKVTPADNSYLTNNLALSLLLNEKHDEAIALLEPLATTPDASPTVRQNLALAYGITGRKDKALEMGLKDLGRKAAAENLKFYTRYMQENPVKPKEKPAAPVGKVDAVALPGTLPAKAGKDPLLKPEIPAQSKTAAPAVPVEPKQETKKEAVKKEVAGEEEKPKTLPEKPLP